MKNVEILNANEALVKLMKERFPVKTSSGLVKVARALQSSVEDFETTRKKLIEDYGIKVEDGKITSEQEDGVEKFVAEVNELGEQEVEVKVDKVKLPEKVAATCDQCHHNMDRPLEIEPSVLMALEKFIDI